MRKLTTEEVRNMVLEMGYDMVGEYTGRRNPIEIICKCGNHYFPQAGNFIYGKSLRCDECGRKNVSKRFLQTYEEVFGYVEDNGNGDVLLSEKYSGNGKIEILCGVCGKNYKILFSSFKLGHRCSHCGIASRTRKSRLSAEEIWSDLSRRGLIFVNYQTYDDVDWPKMTVSCSICSYTWETTWLFIRGNSACGMCNRSRGERKIENFLIENNIFFLPQHKFDDCKNVRRLLFDFYLPEHNTGIEFNGMQHYEENEFFGGTKGFQETIFRDKIKEEYCLPQGINLLVIPYWEKDNIEQILTNYLFS